MGSLIVALQDLTLVRSWSPGPMKGELGFKAARREAIEGSGTYALRERSEPYGANFTGKSEALSSENTRFWNENSKLTPT
jgi:hypothetical protein